MSKYSALAAAFVVLAGLAIGGYFIAVGGDQNECSTARVAGGKSAIGGGFNLVNHKSEPVTDKDVITGLTLVYFGYTFCPDVCPLDNARNAEAIDLLEAQDIDASLVFISIDPARDTPEALADFVEAMHPKMIGLTGTFEQVDAASKAYKTYYKKNGDDDQDYLMDHSTFTYLMSAKDGLLDYFGRDTTPEQIARTVACFAGR